MKRAIFLATAALLAMLILAPIAWARDGTTNLQTYVDYAITGSTMAETTTSGTQAGIPESGGPAILLPAATVLLGSGILTYAILRRR